MRSKQYAAGVQKAGSAGDGSGAMSAAGRGRGGRAGSTRRAVWYSAGGAAAQFTVLFASSAPLPSSACSLAATLVFRFASSGCAKGAIGAC